MTESAWYLHVSSVEHHCVVEVSMRVAPLKFFKFSGLNVLRKSYIATALLWHFLGMNSKFENFNQQLAVVVITKESCLRVFAANMPVISSITRNPPLPYSTWAFFEPSIMGGMSLPPPPPPHHNFVAIAPMIMKFGRDIKLDVSCTMVTKSL